MTERIDTMRGRMREVLPSGWFGDTAPVLDAILDGFGSCWLAIEDLIRDARTQIRIRTATDQWLDAISQDFFGGRLGRAVGESDASYRQRVRTELLRERGTRASVVDSVATLTGREPDIFEPSRPADTGSYGGLSGSATNDTGAGYGVAGGWGSLHHAYQIFVTAYRPHIAGTAGGSGWGSGAYGLGHSVYMSLESARGGISDDDIASSVQNVLPISTRAWLRITN